MSIEKIMEVQNPQEFIDAVLNFLDIKVNKPSNEKVNAILNEIFELLNNQPKASRGNLESRFIEKLSFELLKFDKKDFQNKLDVSNQKTEKTDIIKVQQTATDLKNDPSKNESFQNQNKAFLDSPFTNPKNNKKIETQQKLNIQFLENLFKSCDKKIVFTEDKLALFLNCIKKALDSFKKEDESLNGRKDSSINPNKELLDLPEKTIKLNFKLFNENNSRILQEQITFIQNRLDQIPLGIVGFHMKEKDKKMRLTKSKKKNRSFKQMKYKQDNLE